MIQIRRKDYELMLDQLQAAYPLEACGLLAGRDQVVYAHYPVDNRLASRTMYEMEPEQQLAAMLDLEERGWEILAIYHSHPGGPETPSPLDIAQAYYPDSAYIIVSLRNRQQPSVRAFTIVENQVQEIPFRVI